MSDKKQQSYTDKFRREAVRRADEPGMTAKQVAKELGINTNLIHNWRSQFKKIDKLRAGETISSSGYYRFLDRTEPTGQTA